MERRQVLKLTAAAAAVAFVGPLAAPKKGWSLEGTMDLTVFERDQRRLEALMPALRDIVEKQDWRFDEIENQPANDLVRAQLDAAISAELPHGFDWNIVPGSKPADREIVYACFNAMTMFHRLEVIVYNGPIWASIDVVRHFAFPALVPSREERLNTLMPELKRIIETAEPGRPMRYQMHRAVAAAFPGELFVWSIGPTWPASLGHHFLSVRIAPGAANSIGGLASVFRGGAQITMEQQCIDRLDHEAILTD